MRKGGTLGFLRIDTFLYLSDAEDAKIVHEKLF